MNQNMKPEDMQEISKRLEEQIKLKIYDSILGLLDDEKKTNQTFAPIIEMVEKLKPGSKEKIIQSIQENMLKSQNVQTEEPQSVQTEEPADPQKVVSNKKPMKRRKKLPKLQSQRRKRR